MHRSIFFSGPYLFGWGLVLFLLQKEIWVMEHEFWHLPNMLLLCYLIHKLGSKQLGEYFDKEQNEQPNMLLKWRKAEEQSMHDGIEVVGARWI